MNHDIIQNRLLNRETLQTHLEEKLKWRLGCRSRGLRLPVDKELAQEMEVSVPTLRKALEGLASKGYIESAEGSGWRVTHRVHDRRVAVLCDLEEGYLSRTQECRRQLQQAGYAVNVYLGDLRSGENPPTRLSNRQFLEDLETRGFVGVIAPWAYPHREWKDRLDEMGIPLVGFGVLHEYAITYDMETYIKSALRLLKQKGVRHVAYLNGVTAWREKGYDEQLLNDVFRWIEESGLESKEEWVTQNWHRNVPGAAWSSFRELWTAHTVRPEAVILGVAPLWYGFEEAARSMGVRIPEEIQVVLAHDSMGSSLWSRLPVTRFISDTSVHVRAGVNMLVDLMEGRPVENKCLHVDSWKIEDCIVNKEYTMLSPPHMDRLHPQVINEQEL